ncbi:SDR family oxidoreductase [Leifsonia sp. F6_8S_P_1B]|uniref:SDR family oxidoreductase n=1 Tax=Leifsonia williamsii TaxID=3035919 RepID=A0ABT8KET4_9MICO|nr:SDR family oxidoreductase [Leifsonia williamsii]MDN4615508.1 SDR family oxidoreductase [Leifsonia williamsii]
MEITDFSTALFSLEGKRAMVTGGNGGLGRAFTVALAAAGADVFVPSLADDDGTTARLVEGHGRRYAFAAADITRTGVPQEMVGQCVETLGGLDILVNSAGINLLDDVTAFGRDKWDPMLAVNLTAAFDFAHAAARAMIPQRSGKIVNIASLFSFLGGKQSPAYAASKAGIVGFTKAYADELGEYGIQVNAIAPGYFATALTERTRSDAVANARIVDHVPAGRWGDPADLMGALVFLSSRAADYVTGHTLVVDGGYLLR